MIVWDRDVPKKCENEKERIYRCVDCGKELPEHECECELLPDGGLRCIGCVIKQRDTAKQRLRNVMDLLGPEVADRMTDIKNPGPFGTIVEAVGLIRELKELVGRTDHKVKESEPQGCVGCGCSTDANSQEAGLMPGGAVGSRIGCLIEQRDQYDARRRESIAKYEELRGDYQKLKTVCTVESREDLIRVFRLDDPVVRKLMCDLIAEMGRFLSTAEVLKEPEKSIKVPMNEMRALILGDMLEAGRIEKGNYGKAREYANDVIVQFLEGHPSTLGAMTTHESFRQWWEEYKKGSTYGD